MKSSTSSWAQLVLICNKSLKLGKGSSRSYGSKRFMERKRLIAHCSDFFWKRKLRNDNKFSLVVCRASHAASCGIFCFLKHCINLIDRKVFRRWYVYVPPGLKGLKSSRVVKLRFLPTVDWELNKTSDEGWWSPVRPTAESVTGAFYVHINQLL